MAGDFHGNTETYRRQKRFRQDHSAEITLYETARKILKERAGGKKLPSMKMLKAEKEKLSAQKNSQYKTYRELKDILGFNSRTSQPRALKALLRMAWV